MVVFQFGRVGTHLQGAVVSVSAAVPSCEVRAGAKVLHICSDFARQSIYDQLVTHLDELGIEQLVYVPVRTQAELEAGRNRNLVRTRFRFAHVLRPAHRVFFNAKVRRVYDDVIAHGDPKAFDLVHAHFLYSDGAVALRIFRASGIPFVVAVRNTDVNVFMRLRPDLLRVCCEIIEQAQRVIFITPSYLEPVVARLPRLVGAALRRKAVVVPNGVAPFWLDAEPAPFPVLGEQLRLLYVGDFSRNKNVANTIRAAALAARSRPVRLTLVGAGGNGEATVSTMLASGAYPFVIKLGRIDEPRRLLDIYRQHDIFVMPSFRETFGLVYLEALSQGLPIVYSRGQGVDGYFEPHTVAEAADPHDPVDINAAISSVSERLDAIRPACRASIGPFSWPRIARTYADIYRAVSSS